MSRMGTFFLNAAILLLGCTPEEAADQPAESPPVTAEPQEDVSEGVAETARSSRLLFLARGNEPFWGLRIFPERLRFNELGQVPIELADPKDLSEPETGTWTWSAEGEEVSISVTIERRPCDDTMADVSYEYAASVRIGDRTLQGCAIRGGSEE